MENDNDYLLTLAAIAKEIQQRGEKRECAVNLGAGLPLAGFGREKKAFREYLLRSSQPVSFKFEGISYQVTIQDVRLFPQGCSAIAVHPEFIRGEPSVLLMDIGGWTVDLMRLDSGIPNASACRSLELGMIRCIDEAKEQGYENGRFSFRYTNCLGYRKGADGKPEIHPEEAKTIRMIFENFLNGDSIDDIKQCLENKGILTPTGHTEWNKQTIVRILKNEKYMGDVLLQKTYTPNLFEGKHKKNNGEVTQYYIKNHHPAIVSREMFQLAQEELARRNSKKPVTQKKAKTNRGRFTSKYPLSERLVCGNCGCYYRRITWDIHGRKQVVWRCINRVEFGKRYCGDSPSIPEEALHHAILEAIRSLIQNHQKDIEANLENALLDSFSDNLDELPPEAVKNKLKKLKQEFDQLLIMAGE